MSTYQCRADSYALDRAYILYNTSRPDFAYQRGSTSVALAHGCSLKCRSGSASRRGIRLRPYGRAHSVGRHNTRIYFTIGRQCFYATSCTGARARRVIATICCTPLAAQIRISSVSRYQYFETFTALNAIHGDEVLARCTRRRRPAWLLILIYT